MKKYAGLCAVLLMALVFTGGVAHAEKGGQDAEKGSWAYGARTEFKEQMQAERQAFMDKLKTDKEAFLADLKTKKEEWKNAREELKTEFWGKAKRMIGERFEVAVTNLERMQERVGAVIQKLEDKNNDMDAATEALNASKQKLEDAKAKLEDLKAALPATDTAITPEVWETVKTLARETKDLLKESRESLHQSILAIKDVVSQNQGDNENEQEND